MLKSLFSTRKPKMLPSGPAGHRAYAVGDIHGRLDLLERLVAKIEAFDAERPAAKTHFIFLGDYVDRGPDSKGVIDYLLSHDWGGNRTAFLHGNHEEFFLRAIEGKADGLQSWLTYGGVECLASYGINIGWLLNASPDAILDRVRATVPKAHRDFLKDMHDSLRFGDYVFVHAGIRPGIPIEDQSPQDLRWIREAFLDSREDHGAMVVHGHTISEGPDIRPNRIGIDTGAYQTGLLTALMIDGAEREFLSVQAP